MNEFICNITLPEETHPSDYIQDKNCFDCDTELVNNENCFNHVCDIHQLVCQKCKTRYIKYMRNGFLKKL